MARVTRLLAPLILPELRRPLVRLAGPGGMGGSSSERATEPADEPDGQSHPPRRARLHLDHRFSNAA